MIAAFLPVVCAVLLAQSQGPRTGAVSPSPSANSGRMVPAIRMLQVPASAIHLDGRLDEVEWSQADSITDLRQRDPDNGAPASERTVIRILGTPDALLIGVRAYDSSPGDIRATQLRRDADLGTDDHVALLIDSFRDNRGAFVFQTNPNGAHLDAQLDVSEGGNKNWNGIWDVRTTRDSLGWTAEFRIPFSTLRYHPGETAFGFNIARVIRRRNEESLWQSWGRTQGLPQLQNAGEIRGLPTLTRGHGLELRPYLLGRGEMNGYDLTGDRVSDGGVSAKVGLDAKLAVTPTLTADLTLNTDFAQVESDQQLINLTQFPLYYPEKREFFLESSGLFQFGNTERAQLFYSRRIGRLGGAEVPITGGARVYGKVGPWALGLLGARTGKGEEAGDFVVRAKHDLFDRGYVGMMATQRSIAGGDGAERSAGLDVGVPLIWKDQNVDPSFWVAGTRAPGESRTSTAWHAAVDLPNDGFEGFVSLDRIEPGFQPTLGFVREAGILETSGYFNFRPRPKRLGVRRLDFKVLPSWEIIADIKGSLLHSADWKRAEFEWRPLGAEFESGDQLEINVQRVLDTSVEGFDLFGGVVVPAGRYWWTRGEVQYESSSGRPFSVESQLSFGGFYSGTNTEAEVGITWRPGGRLIAALSATRSAVRLPVGNFNATEISHRLEYAFNTRADFVAFVQYNNEDQRVDASLRFHYIPTIGDDLFVVWNSGYSTDPLARSRFPALRALSQPLEGALVIKAVHRFVP